MEIAARLTTASVAGLVFWALACAALGYALDRLRPDDEE